MSDFDLSLEMANRALRAAEEKSRELGVALTTVLVDQGGNLKAFSRMDNAWIGSIDIAIKKARTSRYFDRATEEIGQLSQPGGKLYQIEHSNDGLITFPGGLPIKNPQGRIVGAVGVSGSTVEHDRIVAEAAVAALQ